MASRATNSLATSQNNSIAQAEVAPQQGADAQEQEQITIFNDDMAIIPEHVPMEHSVPSFLTDQFTDSSTHSIISFLERPQLQSSFRWEYAQSGGASGLNQIGYDLLNAGSTPGLLVPSQIFRPMTIRKLDGFAGFKATVVFKLQVNSQPFMAGRLLMAATPMPTLLGPREQFLASTISNLQCIHHVQMDIAKQTEVELRVPFVSPYNCYDLTSGYFDWAKLYIKVYSPLNTTVNGTALECLLWSHFENIELGFPTSAFLNTDIIPAPSNLKKVKEEMDRSRQQQVKELTTSERVWADLPEDLQRKYDIDHTRRSVQYPTTQSGSVRSLMPSQSYSVLISSEQMTPPLLNIPIPSRSLVRFSINTFIISAAENTAARFGLTVGGSQAFYRTWLVNKLTYGNQYNFSNSFDIMCDSNITVLHTYTDGSIRNVMSEVFVTVYPFIATESGNSPIDINIVRSIPLCSNSGGSSVTGVVRIDPASLPLWTADNPRTENENQASIADIRSQNSPNPNLYKDLPESVKQQYPEPQAGKVTAKASSRAPPKETAPGAVTKARKIEKQKAGVTPVAASIQSWGSRLKSASGAVIDGVTGIGSGIAGFFGWSKPQLDGTCNSVVIRPTEYFANCDGADHSLVLALTVGNNVDNYPSLSGSQADETSFDYLKRIPNFIGSFQYGEDASTLTTNNILTAMLVSPVYTQPWVLNFSGFYAEAMRMPTSLGYISSPFAYWTGSLVYTFRFVKTDYHSGRVEFSFHPFVTEVSTALSQQARYDQVYRVIVDLRENSEVSITVPYVSPQPWKLLEFNTVNFDPFMNNRSEAPVSDLKYCTGILIVRKLTPLIVQNNIAPRTIECVVEVRGGDDYQVACPTHNAYLPFSFDQLPTPQAGIVFATPGTSDTRTRALEGYVPPSITGKQTDIERGSAEQFTMGEAFSSFRYYTRRFNFSKQIDISPEPLDLVRWNANSNPPGYVVETEYQQRSAVVTPFSFVQPPKIAVRGIFRNTIATGAPQRYATLGFRQLPTPLSFVAGSFCFFRGGIRIKTCAINTYDGQVISNNLTVGKLVYHRHFDPGDDPEDNLESILPHVPKINSPAGYEQHVQKAFGEFQIPYYSPTIQSCHWNTRGYTLFDRPVPWLEIQIAKDTRAGGMFTPRLCIAAAASDDMDFSMYIGPCPVLETGATRTNDVTEIVENINGRTVQFGYYRFNNLSTFDADPAYTLAKQQPYTPSALDMQSMPRTGQQYLWSEERTTNLRFEQVSIDFRQNLGPPPTTSR